MHPSIWIYCGGPAHMMCKSFVLLQVSWSILHPCSWNTFANGVKRKSDVFLFLASNILSIKYTFVQNIRHIILILQTKLFEQTLCTLQCTVFFHFYFLFMKIFLTFKEWRNTVCVWFQSKSGVFQGMKQKSVQFIKITIQNFYFQIDRQMGFYLVHTTALETQVQSFWLIPFSYVPIKLC